MTESTNSFRNSLPFEPAQFLAPVGDWGNPEVADAKGKRIGILIVSYNAATTLLPVLKRIPPAVWQNVEEVVVYDDASSDATYELAVGAKTLHDLPKLRILKHPRNLGYGGNQKAGYQYLIERGFDVVVLLHGDGQYAPEIMAHLYAPLVRGEAEAVFGSRMMSDYGGPLKGGMPLYKFVGNRILTTFENRALGLRLTEFHSGYRAYSLHALRRIAMEKMTNDFHFDTEIIIKLRHQGFRIREVPIPTYYGDELCYVDGMKYARNVFRAVRRYRQTVRAVICHPEFEEYWHRYPLKQADYSSHDWVRRTISGPLRVLDLGCGDGYLAEVIAGSGCRVTGVDEVAEPARREVLEAYHRCDLSGGLSAVLPELPERGFDRILLMDVLEHVPRPEVLLAQIQPLLKAEGQIVVSVPNVANLTVRLMLLLGMWNYADRGILDRTHLRFFTRKTARELLESQGFKVERMLMTVMPVELVLGLPPRSRLMRGLSQLLQALTRILPGLLGYQIMMFARGRESHAAGRD